MREFSLGHFSRNSTDITTLANREPVALTHYRKPRYVLMSYDDYQRLMAKKPNPRRVYGPGETPADLAAMILPELDKVIADGETEND